MNLEKILHSLRTASQMVNINQKKWIIGVTGASGIPYALRLIEYLSSIISEVNVVFSEAAVRVVHEEHKKISGSRLNSVGLFGKELPGVKFFNPKDIGAPFASGSYKFDGMVVVPCSMNTLAAIASGMSGNLIHRAADVTIKENRRLIIVPRETPLSQIHLENMLRLSRLGVTICPAMPGFYHKPKTIADLVDMMVMKILDLMGIDNSLVTRWREENVREPIYSLDSVVGFDNFKRQMVRI